jgi:hypothetical protein
MVEQQLGRPVVKAFSNIFAQHLLGGWVDLQARPGALPSRLRSGAPPRPALVASPLPLDGRSGSRPNARGDRVHEPRERASEWPQIPCQRTATKSHQERGAADREYFELA